MYRHAERLPHCVGCGCERAPHAMASLQADGWQCWHCVVALAQKPRPIPMFTVASFAACCVLFAFVLLGWMGLGLAIGVAWAQLG